MTRRHRPPGRPFGAVAWGFLLITAVSFGALGGDAPRFVAGLEDLPLMPGLSTLEDTAVVFDTPQGRIVEAFATGTMSRAAIEAFYAETLPQLGWTKADEGGWLREGEALRLEFVEADQDRGQGLIVRFALSPE